MEHKVDHTTPEPPFGVKNSHQSAPTGVTTNNSSSGVNGPFPDELRHWNWGAFLGSLYWCRKNNIPTLWIIFCIVIYALNFLLLPFAWIVLLGTEIYLGFKGNELAWRYRKFPSVVECKNYQKRLIKPAAIVWVLPFIFSVVIYPILLFIWMVFAATVFQVKVP
jgi:hypothetical protein